MARFSFPKIFMAVVVTFYILKPAHCIKLWPSPGSLPNTIPASCRAALSTNVTCPDLITAREIANNVPINPKFLNGFCAEGCMTSLYTWAANINTRCGNTVYSFGNATNQSGNDIAQPLLWAHSVACLTEPTTNAFCYPKVINRTVTACEDCTLKYLSGMLNSTFGHRKISDNSFSSLVSSCGLSPTKFPHSTITFTPAPTTGIPRPSCLGTPYTVELGDTCKSIAAANNVAIDRFLSDNSIDFSCEGLTDGSSVCIGDSCTLQTVATNQTCENILSDKSFSIVQLLSWNPVIHSNCDNLDALVGRDICVSPPGSGDWDVPITVSWNDTYTVPAGDWSALPSAVDASNSTRSDPYAFGTVATASVTADMEALSAGAARVTNCPVNNEAVQRGFEWEYLPEDCQSILEEYCTPFMESPAPPSTTFASSCLPSVIMGW